MLADYHMHSYPLSQDAESAMREMAAGALEAGMTHICFTNHMDNCSLVADGPWGSFADWEAMEREFAETKAAFSGKLDIRLGAELSCPHYVPEEGRALYGRACLDFVIGSVHNLRHKKDFYFYDYPPFEQLRPEIVEYLDEYIAMVRFGCCDVLGHIGYMQRYMSKQGKFFNMMEFSDQLRTLFTLCAEKGVGIEVNTSGLASPLADFVPNREVLKLYRACGGELVTAGSDSHRASDAGHGIREAYELLRECGFRYVALYSEHKPELVRL